MRTGSGPRAARDGTRADLTGVILCGGESRRMGSVGDKARMKVGEHSLLESAVACLDAIVPRVVLACGPAPRYAELGRDLALDSEAGSGPLAGLCAGFETATTEWVAALACDMPRAAGELFLALHDVARAEELDACLLATEGGLEPLFAVYRRATCLEATRAALRSGERKLISFHPGLRVASRTAYELGMDHADPATNLNTPEDLERERRRRQP